MQWPLMMAEGSAEGSAGGAPPASGPDAGSGQSTSLMQDGSNLLDWRAGLTENERSLPIVQRLNTLGDAVRTLDEQERALGRSLAMLPKEPPDTDAYKTGMQKIYDKLGRPAKPDEYTFTLPEGRTLDPDIQARWQHAFHESGLNPTQAQAILDEYWRTVSYAENIYAGQEQESYQQGRKALFAEFGANTEGFLQDAQHFFDHFGRGAFLGEAGKKAWEAMQEAKLKDGSRLINSPYLIAAFAEAGKRMGEGEYRESTYYEAGKNTMETMAARQRELTAKRHTGGLTEGEFNELLRINDQVLAAEARATRAA